MKNKYYTERNRYALYPGQKIRLIYWARFRGDRKSRPHVTINEVVGIDYKNPRARIRVKTINSKKPKEYLVYARNIIGYGY